MCLACLLQIRDAHYGREGMRSSFMLDDHFSQGTRMCTKDMNVIQGELSTYGLDGHSSQAITTGHPV